MRSIEEIRELGDYLVTEYHGERLAQQVIDQSYYDDTFLPELLKPPATNHPTGEAAKQIDLPAEHLITGNPQAFRIARTKGEVEKAIKVAKMQNYWLQRIKRQSPDPLHLSLKTNLTRGEVYTQLVLNKDWTSKNQEGLPVWFHIPDPMTIFPSAKGQDCIPEEVIVWSFRDVAEIEKAWPEWEYKGQDKRIWYLAYYSKDQRYFEAGNEHIHEDGNIMGIVPFVHVYTGYGNASPNANPENLVVGRLRYMRSRLDAERTLFSDSISLTHRFAYGDIDFERTDASVPDDALKKYSKKPFEVKLLPFGVRPAASKELLQNLNYILEQLAVVRTSLRGELSPILEGAMLGSSGRQDDMATSNALRRYETVMDNHQTLWARSLSQALKVIDTVPNMLPISVYAEDITDGVRLLKEVSVTKDDIGGYYDCTVELKAADTIDQDRNAMMWRQDWQAGYVSHKKSLIEGKNMTEDQAVEELEDVMVDSVTERNPEYVAMIGRLYAQAKGLPMELVTPQEGTQPRKQEIKTERGRQETDVALTQRGVRPPPGAVQ